MKLIYISCPYRAKTEAEIKKNIDNAWYWASTWMQRDGWFAVTPNLNSAFMGGLVDDHKFLEGDKRLLEVCDAVFMCPGWEGSVGCNAERDLAIDLGIPVISDFPETGYE